MEEKIIVKSTRFMNEVSDTIKEYLRLCLFIPFCFGLIMAAKFGFQNDESIFFLLLGSMMTIVLLILYWWLCSMNIVVTNERICGNTAFGRKIDLTLNSVSSVGFSGLWGIYVTTNLDRIDFKCIKNREEIHSAISKLLLKQTKQNESDYVTCKHLEYISYHSMAKHILLCIFTLGIWQYIWIWRTTKFLNQAPKAEQYNPTKKLLLCMFVPFYLIYWLYKHGQRIDAMYKDKNLGNSDMATLCLILGIFIPIVAYIIMQDKINTLCTVKTNEVNEDINENKEINFEDLNKLKDLLDSGIITQEEFEQKKKQLLGL